MKRRPYRDGRDLDLLQTFNGESFAATDGCGYLHPGDIPHHVYNGNKHYDPPDLLSIWEDEDGVAAWVLAQPRHKGFDAQIRPGLRSSAFAAEVLAFAEKRTIEVMQQHQIDGDEVEFYAYQCDAETAETLRELGWKKSPDAPWTINRICLEDAPEGPLPDGYRMRAVKGLEEAAAIAGAHAAAFPGAKWTPELYRYVMESPGYDPKREFVVVAPDGTLAAFTVTWHDPISKTGLFEPVGTHADYRRRGLGKALLRFGMGEMKRAGMKSAIVMNAPTNEASIALYRSCGFEPLHLIDDYTKPIAS